MQITEVRNEHSVTLTISGRIDVETSATLESEISNWLTSPVVWTLILDLSAVEYISSAGIRVLLSAQKKMKEKHELIIRNPSQFCKQVFEVTGADIFLKIEYK
ncbi:STAS domain-containing protein [Treponema sp.]|uniref:STAS domain-containing protein n=1 Tax=Treponema sp. TaxID=166 RepID=UPI00388DC07C